MSRTALERLGTLMYVVQPNKTTFEHPEDVPNYENEAVPFFAAIILLEMFARWALGKEVRMNENIASMSFGVLHEATVFVSGWFLFVGYEWLYQFRIFTLPWDSLYTWFGAFLFVDLVYYWIHRANHEINLLWAAHQVHHSSEDYNLTVGVRLSIFQRATYLGFYQSLALLGFPLSSVLVHAAFNYTFQVWFHTSFIKKLGPLEYIFVTPSHHRVHHGANKWCLDKNYGGVFIIWDRIFGTFVAERDDEEIVFGLTDQKKTFNVVWHELYYFGVIYRKFKSMSSWGDSLKAVFYGPGWSPGTGRLGDPDTFPDIKAPRIKHNEPQLAKWKIAYTTFHVSLLFLLQQYFVTLLPTASWLTISVYLTFMFATFGIIGGMFDGKLWAGILEAFRCAAVITYSRAVPITNNPLIDTTVVTIYSVSMMIWMMDSMTVLKPSLKVLKME